MKKIFHFKRGAGIPQILRRGTRADSEFFSVIFYPKRATHPRFACVVSRAVDKRAVARNTLRRRTREWFRTRADFEKSTCDVVILFKKSARGVSAGALYKKLAEAAQPFINACIPV